MGNEIHADGDRYIDLDPAVFEGLVKDNRIYVTITEGVKQVRGGLLELRGKQNLVKHSFVDPNYPYLRRVAPGEIPDSNMVSWALEELRLIDDAKVNLTNRFDFQAPYDEGGNNEVLYVKNLILGKKAVLNTAYNLIYYENLTVEPNAVIPNIPLLGFSLSNIALNSDMEFATRVVHNNFVDPEPEPPDHGRTHVERVDGLELDPNGMMRMRNLMDADPCSLTYGQTICARAKGTFAKVNEDQMLILFEYLFDSDDPNMELVIYLSDVPELDEVRDLNHSLEVAKLAAPPPGRAGAYDSGRFGVFQEYVSTGDLNFVRGTRMELELAGEMGSSILINNWDPMIICDPLQLYCKDVTGDFGVTAVDFLSIFGEYGNSASPTSDMMAPLGRVCLDGSFNKDGYVDLNDLLEWDWFLSPPERLNNCDIPLAPGQSSSSASGIEMSSFFETDDDFFLPAPDDLEGADDPAESFLIASKWIHNISPYYLQDTLYTFDQTGQAVGSIPPAFNHMGSRLVTDKAGGVYQIHMENGLVEFWNPSVPIVAPGAFSDVAEPRNGQSATVYVGLQQQGNDWAGRPLLDAAIDDQGFIYVLPVVVSPTANPNATYLVAAKLQPQPGQTPAYSLVALFDETPLPGDNQQRNALREIEIDDNDNLYVVNSHDLNESDILWVFDTETAAVKQRLDLIDRNIPAPSAMHISDDGNTLYLTSSQNSPDATTSTLMGLSTVDLTVVRSVTINDMGHITTVVQDPTNQTVWAAGFKMTNIPQYPDSSYPPFYFPYLAQVPAGSDDPVSAVAMSGATNMSVPMSMVWIGETADQCGGADLDGKGSVNLTDLSIMLSYWLDTNCIPPDGCGQANFDNTDGKDTVNLLDFAMFAQYWLKMDCR
ncbi:MAG: hypothetical protein GY869_07275 [Planctomycetes bacterium]|nr:hypothetical protein [Planctomycetota bacterium]